MERDGSKINIRSTRALIRRKLSFTGVVSITLSFHPQGRNVNDVLLINEGFHSLRPLI